MLDSLLHKLKLDSKEFLFQFQSHPEYPSALAFSDTLNFMGVKNQVYQVEKEFWNELPNSFIALYKNEFNLVERQGLQVVLHGNDVQKKDFDEVTKGSSDVVFLYERPTDSIIHKTGSAANYIFYLGAAIAIGVLALHFNVWQFSFGLLSLIGVYLFADIFKDKFGLAAPAMQRLCGGNVALSTGKTSGCDQIIKGDHNKFLGLKFADFGLVYLIGLLLSGILMGEAFMIKVLSTVALVAVAYSVYYQLKHKAFCRVCASAGVLLLAQAAITWLGFETSSFTLQEFLLTGVLFLFILGGIMLLNTVIEERQRYQKENLVNLKFKRNYGLFRQTLLAKDRVAFKQQGLIIGDSQAPLRISMVSNPYCGFCKDAHHLLGNLWLAHPEKIALSFRFNYFPKSDDESLTFLMKSFQSIVDSNKLTDAINFWYETRDIQNYKTKYPLIKEEISLEAIVNTAQENQQKNFTFTPIFFINGYQYPDLYAREDLSYFIEDLLEDGEILNRSTPG